MEKTLITVDVPNVISIGVILFFVLVLYGLICTYALRWMTPATNDATGGASF